MSGTTQTTACPACGVIKETTATATDTDPATPPAPFGWPALMDMSTTAKYLGVTRYTVQRWLGDGLIPRPIRFDAAGEQKARARWVRAELDKFLAEQHAVANRNESKYWDAAENMKAERTARRSRQRGGDVASNDRVGTGGTAAEMNGGQRG